MTLKIYLLGQFRLQHLDEPIDLPSRPAQSLLAYLVLNSDVAHRREKLAGLLWPDSEESNARSYLRQALWRIRKSLESAGLEAHQYLKIDKINVCFDRKSDYWLDADVLRELGDSPTCDQLMESSAVYKGELLPGFYDDWVDIEREHLRSAYHQKMNLLLDGLLKARAWEQVLEWGEQWIRLGNAPEPAYRAMMESYAGLGQPSMIRSMYERCCEALERELGMEPSDDLRTFLQRLESSGRREDHLVRQPRSTKPLPVFDQETAGSIESPAFVAREPELVQLKHHLQSAFLNEGRVVFVIGDAGSGKTALLKEFTRRALDEYPALIVANGNCNAHTGMGDPYLPLREILGMLAGDVEPRLKARAITAEHAQRLWQTMPLTAQILIERGPGLINTFISGSSLLQRLGAANLEEPSRDTHLQEQLRRAGSIPTEPAPQQDALFEQYTRVLQELSKQVPLMLLLDDLQWADSGSIGLLFHLGRQLSGCPVLIVGAYRSEEVAAGRHGERHPLESVVNEFQREFGNICVDLGESDRREFVEAILDSEPNLLGEEFRDMLHHQTQGHPLFTTELLRGMQDRGDLVKDSQGRWVTSSSLDWETMPARVEAVFAERIGRLSPQLRDILQAASVEGETFTAEVIARVLGIDDRMILTLLSNELDRQHRLVSAESIQRIDGRFISRYRFRHILFQRYLYSNLDEIERVHRHEQVGTYLEALLATRDDASLEPLQLARQFEEAGNTKKAIHYLHEAGKRALQLSAYKDGSAHLCKGLDLLNTLPESLEKDELELKLQLAIGLTWKYNWGSPEGVKAIERTSELCRQLGKPAPFSRAMGELATYHYVQAEYRQALEYAQEALQLAEQADDPLLVAEGHWLQGILQFCLGEYQQASDHLGQVTAFYNPTEHHRAMIQLRGVDSGLSAMAYHACSLWCLGYPDQAQRISQQALALAHKFKHPFTLADILCYAGCMFNAMYRDPQALYQHAQELVQLSTEKLLSLSGWSGMGLCFQGSAMAMVGQTKQAIKEIRTGISVSEESNVHLYRPVALRFLAAAQAADGQVHAGLESLAEAISLVDSVEDRHWEADLHRLRGECLAQLGDSDGAERSYLHALDVARKQNAKSWELRISTSLARLWQKQEKIVQARAQLAEVYNWFSEGFETADVREAEILLKELS
jgi:predicted ATPase/DNA-binding SARP family transcriptional activator